MNRKVLLISGLFSMIILGASQLGFVRATEPISTCPSLSTATYFLKGYVTYRTVSGSIPAEGVQVYAKKVTGDVFTCLTDESGVYALEVAKGRYKLGVFGPYGIRFLPEMRRVGAVSGGNYGLDFEGQLE